jgi:lysozyme-like protein
MPQLTDQQIAELAAAAGFTGNDLDTAVAVALAESSGNSDAIGDVSLQTDVFGPSVGLWQIRSVNPGHGNAFDQAHRNQQANMDPATNAANAYAIQQQSGWNQWSTYTGGDYRRFLDRARAAQQGGGTQTPTPQPAPAQRPAGQNGGQSSNSQGFMGELQKLIESISKLANPQQTLNKASQGAQRAAANSSAFGKVAGSSAAHQKHSSNTRCYAEHASRGSERVRVQSDDIRGTANDYDAFSQQGVRNIDQTTQGVREDMIAPPLPPNVA